MQNRAQWEVTEKEKVTRCKRFPASLYIVYNLSPKLKHRPLKITKETSAKKNEEGEKNKEGGKK